MTHPSFSALYPGSVLGVLGGGQLGRMFAIAALRMGYKVWVLDPDKNSPAGLIASRHVCATYDDADALEIMAQCDAITIEFENIPLATLEYLEGKTRVAPGSRAVAIAQDRSTEKNFARSHGIATAGYANIESTEQIVDACAAVGFPAILKTARLGYDGKGQQVCKSLNEVQAAYTEMGYVPCVLEKRIDLACEVSVILGRSTDGLIKTFPVAENIHEDGILDITMVPARVDAAVSEQAVLMATRLATELDYVGVLAVEFFISTDNEVMVNEIAPRPHNSGHYTLDATACCQFEQQVRALAGLSFGSPRLLSPVAMLNLLGDRWNRGPGWPSLYDQETNNQCSVHLHLYGKEEARDGRKMGHVNVLSESPEVCLRVVEELKSTV